MTADGVSDRDRGWQNVQRIIRGNINRLRTKPGDRPLHPVEEAELEAWSLAQDAVIGGLVERNEEDGL